MRLERPAELVGAKPLHLLTQTALPLKSPTGAFIATLRSANAVAPNANYYKSFSAKNGQSKAETISNRPTHKRPLHKMLCNGLLI